MCNEFRLSMNYELRLPLIYELRLFTDLRNYVSHGALNIELLCNANNAEKDEAFSG